MVSETLSFEVLKKFFGAKLPMTEMEVFYFPMDGSINDYVVEITSFRKKNTTRTTVTTITTTIATTTKKNHFINICNHKNHT